MGSPLEPVDDQLLTDPLTVDPKRIEFPHLPSWILSPSNGRMGWILPLSTNVLPKNISVD